MGVFKKLFDELENQCFELDKKIQMELAADSEENDEKIVALRAAQQHSRQAREFHEKANSLQELRNLQSLHSDVNIMPAFFTTMQGEIDKLLENARQEVKKKYSNFFFNVIVVQSTSSIKKVQCMSLNLSMVAQTTVLEK